jgi:hypothetical protein
MDILIYALCVGFVQMYRTGSDPQVSFEQLHSVKLRP